MTHSLKRKTFHALLWSFADRFGQQFIQFAISIVLARLLLPEEFGLIGMLTLFMAIAQIFMDSGFGSALIQKKNADHLDECSIFYFNIFSGVILTALLCAVAPWIAAFYEHDELTTLTQFLALRFLIAPFSSIQSTLLLKKLDFKSIVTIGLISQIVTGAVGIVLAYRGWGVWSLAIQSVSSSFLGCALLWYFNPWRPSLIFSFASLRSMFSYGSRLLASTLLDQLFAEIYTVVIGKVYSAADLGYYTRARGWQRLTSQSLSSVVGRVTFPAFASISDDPPRFKRGLKKSIVFLGFVNFPMMLGLAATAESAVMVLLTEKWAPCIPYIQLLSFAFMLYPIHSINLSVLKAVGRSDLFLRLEVIKKLMAVLIILLTYRYGIKIMIAGQIVSSVISLFINTHYVRILVAYPIKEQMSDLLPCLVISSVMALVVYSVNFVTTDHYLLILISQVIIGTAIYSLLCYLIKLEPFMEIVEKATKRYPTLFLSKRI